MSSYFTVPINLYQQPEFRLLAQNQVNTYHASFRLWHFLLAEAANNNDQGRISAAASLAYTVKEIKQISGITNNRSVDQLCGLLIKVGLLYENEKRALYIANWNQFCPEAQPVHEIDPIKTETVKPAQVTSATKNKKTLNLKHPATPTEQKQAQQIITELAQISGKHFPEAERHEEYVVSWLQRGYLPEQFKQVSLAKSAEWGNQIEMRKFVRPRTLFGPKFINYVNDIVPERPVTVVHHVEPMPRAERLQGLYLDCDRDLNETFRRAKIEGMLITKEELEVEIDGI
ncbi:conserved phage C-terminal domain-containing protein [Loigolactobacillus iwatensis]|uniref:conserved phage C-terminal domain-containing protein n=1 Tax=Loigolactobacillus iwatensis TaxID=1267156 RepID=UPI000F7E6D47|nr:conserved phage C-terminal domain-containing protein [Loigolactobacillus iwatensis]